MAMVVRGLRKESECKSLPERISCSLQDLHAKIHCGLEDEGTLLTMREYMAGAGLRANSEDLANSIAVQTNDSASDGGLQLAAREWLDRLG